MRSCVYRLSISALTVPLTLGVGVARTLEAIGEKLLGASLAV